MNLLLTSSVIKYMPWYVLYRTYVLMLNSEKDIGTFKLSNPGDSKLKKTKVMYVLLLYVLISNSLGMFLLIEFFSISRFKNMTLLQFIEMISHMLVSN